MLLAKRNYKVHADIGFNTTMTVRRVATLDTGAGPNVIRLSELPTAAKAKIKHGPLPRVTDANRNPLRMMGTITLVVRLGRHLAKVEFVVAERLAVPLILGADYCDRFVEAIRPRKRLVELDDGTEIPIVRRPSKRHEASPPLPTEQEFIPRDGRVSPKLRAAERVTLNPGTQTWVKVTSPDHGLRVVQPLDRLYSRSQLAVTNGVVQVHPDKPFKVLVANFGSEPKVVVKDQVIGTLLPHPTAIIPTRVSIADVLNIEDTEPQGYSDIPIQSLNDLEEPSEAEKLKAAEKLVEDLDLSHLASSLRKRVKNMLKRFAPMWSGKLGEINSTPHYIDLLPGSRPIASQPYRAGPKAREIEQREVDKMLQAGVIEPSNSAWASPVVIIPKPDGSLRFCVDYRRLNALTIRDSYPLPRMDECIDSLGEATVFTTLDANAGYWQMPLAHRDRAKSAFVCHSGLYEFVRMPFGLKNAPASFQRALDLILAGFKWKTCLVYIDDVIIFSRTAEEHLVHLSDVLEALQAAGITLKFAKCDFFTDTVKYLGHVIKPGTLSVDNAATASLKGMEYPRNQTELRSFLGLCNVYRRFVPEFARVAGPLNQLLKKGQPVKLEPFGEAERQAFQALIDKITSPPVLALPRSGLPYSVDTDASNYQIGAALFQTHDGGERKPIGFWSRTLNSAEVNYGTPEKECLAVVWALGTLRPYLQGEAFLVHSDQASLRWLMEITEPSGRLMRWRLRLSEFDFVVKYKKGVANTQADALSRLPSSGHTTVEVEEDIPCYTAEATIAKHVSANSYKLSHEANTSEEEQEEFLELDYSYGDDLLALEGFEQDASLLVPVKAEELLLSQRDDAFCKAIRERLNAGQHLPFLVNQDGLLVRTVEPHDQIIVPEALRARILYIHHHAKLAGAPGGRRLYTSLRRHYYWPSMALDSYATVRNCPECAKNRLKLRRTSSALRLFPATNPLESVSIDIMGELIRTPRGNKYLLVMCDRFSKLVRTRPLKRVTALAVAEAFVTHWVLVYGPPADLLSDNGSQFASRLFISICRILGVKNKFTTTYHPQCNGQVERFNRTVLQALRHYVADHPKDWDLFTDALTYAYNTQVHNSTGCTPFELVLSKPPSSLALEALPTLKGEPTSVYHERWTRRLEALMSTAKRELRKAQKRYQRNFNRRQRLPVRDPKPNGYVFLRKDYHEPKVGTKHKLAPVATGPYKVISVSDKTLVIKIGERHERVSRDRVEIAPNPSVEPSRLTSNEEHTTTAVGQVSTTRAQPAGLLDLPSTSALDNTPTGIWIRQAMQPQKARDSIPSSQEHTQTFHRTQADTAQGTFPNDVTHSRTRETPSGDNNRISMQRTAQSGKLVREAQSQSASEIAQAETANEPGQSTENAHGNKGPNRLNGKRNARAPYEHRQHGKWSKLHADTPEAAKTYGTASGGARPKLPIPDIFRPTELGLDTSDSESDSDENQQPIQARDSNPKRKRVSFRNPLTETIPETVHGDSAKPSGFQAQQGRARTNTPIASESANPDGYLEDEYVIDRLVDHYRAEDGSTLYQIRWYGFTARDDTIQPINDVPRSAITSYCRRKRLNYPHDIDSAIPG